MKQHGALFTTDNRMEIRKDHKVQTRRCGKELAEINKTPDKWILGGWDDGFRAFVFYHKNLKDKQIIKPRWSVGDHLYIKEPWATDKLFDAMSFAEIVASKAATIPVWYKDHDTQIDRPEQERGRWRSARFMPKYAARDWLRVTSCKGERLQSISAEDAVAEGVLFMGGIADNWDEAPWCASLKDQEPMASPIGAYARLWDSINPDLPWAWNPWDIAYTFERIKR
jgi:hypothetical protein